MSAGASAVLAGRFAVVTGASRGIGAATARALAAAGARTLLVARSDEALAALARELGEGHLALPADVTDAGAVARLVGHATEWAGGTPDILVNNAGIFPRAPLHDQSGEGFEDALQLNLVAPFRVVRAFLPGMLEQKHGHVVTLGSVADRQAFAGNAAYAASKYGLRALHEVLRLETRGTGVRATLVAPGPVDTEIWDPHEEKLGRSLPARDAMLVADDVARAVLYAVTQPPHVDVEELRLGRA